MYMHFIQNIEIIYIHILLLRQYFLFSSYLSTFILLYLFFWGGG